MCRVKRKKKKKRERELPASCAKLSKAELVPNVCDSHSEDRAGELIALLPGRHTDRDCSALDLL